MIDIVCQDVGFARKTNRFPRKDTRLSIYSHRVNTRHTLTETLNGDNSRNRLAGFRTLQWLPGVGPANAERCFQLIEQGGGSLTAINAFQARARAREDGPEFVRLTAAATTPTGECFTVRSSRHLPRDQLLISGQVIRSAASAGEARTQ